MDVRGDWLGWSFGWDRKNRGPVSQQVCAVTRDLGFSSLIWRTAPFSHLLRHTRGCGGSILTRILTGILKNKISKLPHPIFGLISPLMRTLPFNWINLNSLHPRIICTKIWLILAYWFWRRFFFLNFQCIFTLLLLPPLGEGQSPSFKDTWIPLPQGWFIPSLVKIGPVVLEKIIKGIWFMLFLKNGLKKIYRKNYKNHLISNKHSESIAKAIQVPNRSHQIQTCNL
jgi:hypothetical protein